MMQAGAGNDLLSKYQDMSEKITNLAAKQDQAANATADNANQLFDELLEQRRQISQMVRETPELINVQQRHIEQFVSNEIETAVRDLPDQEAIEELRQSLTKEQFSDLNRQIANDPVNARSFMNQNLTQSRFQNFQKQQQHQIHNVQRAGRYYEELENMPYEQYYEQAKRLGQSSGMPEGFMDQYLGENTDRREFLDRFGPHLTGQYVSSRMGGSSRVDGGEGAHPPNRLDVDETATGDPIHVIIDDVLAGISNRLPVDAGGTGGGGTGTGEGTGPTEPGQPSEPKEDKKKTPEENIDRGFMFQSAMGGLNTIADVATPGGPNMASLAGGIIGGAAQAGGFMGRLGWGPLAAAGAGSLAVNTAISTQEHVRGLESTFGTDQSLGMQGTRDVMGEEIQARLTHWFLTSEEINALTDSVAGLGLSAEETSGVLDQAADALDQYRMLSADTIGAVAAQGSMFSSLGGAEAQVIGATFQDLAGQGMSSEYLSGLAQQGTEMNVYGNERGAEVMAGLAASLQTGTQAQAAAFENMDAAGNMANLVTTARNDPYTLQRLSMMTGTDLSDVDLASPEGATTVGMAPVAIIDRYIPDGVIQVDESGMPVQDANAQRYAARAQMVLEQAGVQMDLPEILLHKVQAEGTKGGVAELQKRAIEGGMGRADEERTKMEEQIMGDKQRQERAENMGAKGIIPDREDWGWAARQMGGAFLPGLIGDTMKSGRPGSNQARDEWRQVEGGPLGALLTVPGIDPDDVKVGQGSATTLHAAIQDPEMRKKLQRGDLRIQTDQGRMTAQRLSEMARAGDAEFERGGIISRGKFDVKGTEDTRSTRVEVGFTDEARRFFKTTDPKDPYTSAGQTTYAQNSDNASRGNSELHSNMPLYGGG